MKQLLVTIFSFLILLPCKSLFGQTITIKKQAQSIISRLKSTGEYSTDAKDTLIDLNGDNFKDILIEYYGASGTGLKNRIRVFLYNNSLKKFRPCEQLNNLGNPTFYFDKKIIVGYYVASGGGSATKFKWNGLRLDTLEQIDVEVFNKNNSTSFEIVSYDFITKRKTHKTLQTMQLPKEYKYWDYVSVIK